VRLHLFVEGQGIGAGGGREAVEANPVAVAVLKMGDGDGCPDLRAGLDAEIAAERVGGFLSGGDDGLAAGQLRQERPDIRWLHHLQELVRRIVLQAADGRGGVVEGDALLPAERDDGLAVENLPAVRNEMIAGGSWGSRTPYTTASAAAGNCRGTAPVHFPAGTARMDAVLPFVG